MKHIYKILSASLAAFLLLLTFSGCAQTDTPDTDDTTEYNRIEVPTEPVTTLLIDPSTTPQPEPPIEPTYITEPYSKAAALYCAQSSALLYNYNINERVAPASLTKLLTALVALHYLDTDTIIAVGTEQSLVKPRSSICLIKPGHKLALYDLIVGMLLPSGNDAAYTIAVSTARSVSGNANLSDTAATEYFCGLMNDFAKRIGMRDSHFTTPEGWDDPGQYTTVHDLLVLSGFAYSNTEIREIVATHQKHVVFASGENITWTNSNFFLDPESEYYREDAVGMKTGTTGEAGNCLISVFEKDGKTYFAVVVGCPEKTDRYELTLKILKEFA